MQEMQQLLVYISTSQSAILHCSDFQIVTLGAFYLLTYTWITPITVLLFLFMK
jgi:hypothetical protein